MAKKRTSRILIIDDNQDIHDDINKILQPEKPSDLDALVQNITGQSLPEPGRLEIQIDSALQGDEGVANVRQAKLEGTPYALIYIDIRMPPGPDGVQTIKQLQQEDAHLQYVVITAYSDYSWQDICKKLSPGDNLLILKKPFEAIEIRQATSALVEKWYLAQERAKAMEELIHRKKMETVAMMAGGICHDFNNLLMGLQGSLDLIRLSCQKNPEKTGVYLSKADRAIDRAVALATQLLTFAKGGAPVKGLELVRLPAMVKEAAEFVLHGSQIKVEYEVEDNIWGVEIDAGQISQVVNNLVTNARQAMADAGIISIKIENFKVAAGDYTDVAPGACVKVSIRDQGCGIDPEIMPRIFEPYFTTKETGSGLGLATSYSIIANHGGLIEVTSELGKGSTLSFILPAVAAAADSDVDVVREKRLQFEVADGRGRILLMDDEAVIREVVSEMLEMLGYEVVTVADGEAMLEVYRASLEEGLNFQAVLMDLSIPGGMGGREAIKLLRELDPEITAIVSSGYSQDPVMADFKAYGFDAMIPKPYKLESLISVLGR